MIQYLQIQNLALIETITLDFEAGFTCITGETGAGKSVLLGALAMLSGNRLDRTIIRQGAEECEVEAAIYVPNPQALDAALAEMDLPPCEDHALLISRSLHQKKVPKIRINGSMTTLSNLAAIGEYWIDFHGPGEPQKLFKERYQLELLDMFSGASELLHSYRMVFDRWRHTDKRLAELREATQLTEDEIHYLREQISKIDELGMDAASLEILENEFSKMTGAEEMSSLLQQIQQNLYDDGGASELLANALHLSRGVADIDASSHALWDRLASLSIELDDMAADVAALHESVQLNEEAIQEIKQRMETWLELKRKYGKTPDHILKARESMAERLATHGDIASTLNHLEAELKNLFDALKSAGTALTACRKKGATELSRQVAENLTELGFKKALFEIVVLEEDEPHEYGTSRCRMEFAPNPGLPLLPLSKIASSGETARVMLGLKAVLAQFDGTPVLVFDEVDANVGGEIGKAVGQKIARLSENHQIFCVTHLPQVAAQGQQHFVVVKSQTEQSTSVDIQALESSGEDRVMELARMLGDRHSSTAITHARELLGTQSG